MNLLLSLKAKRNILLLKSNFKKGDFRLAIKGKANSINKDKIQNFDFDFDLNVDNLLHDKYIMIENGRKNKFIIIAE